MRSLLPLPARSARRGLLGAVAATMVALTAGCSWITGVPDVEAVDISVSPSATFPAGTSVQAIGTAFGKGNKVLQNSRVTVGYSSSNTAVATVNPGTGQVTGVAPGVAVIRASSQKKSDTISVTVLPTPPAAIVLTPPNIAVGQTVTLDIRPLDIAGQLLTGRKLTVTSTNPAVLSITGSGTTSVSATGVAPGTTQLSVEIDGRSIVQTVIVAPPRIGTARIFLAKGTNTLQVGESNQTSIELRDAAGNVMSANGQQIGFQSDDPTIATVTAGGIVVGQRAGTTIIRATIVGFASQPIFTLTVTDLPAQRVLFNNRNPFVRIQADGNGLASQRVAFAFDSLGRPLAGRTINYRSSDNSVLTVNNLGIVTPRRLGGQALVIASADNGAVADTISLRVTEVPIVDIKISPRQQQQIFPGQTIQFTAVLLDSLANAVTSNNVDWFSGNVQILSITQTGLATGLAAGTVTIQAVVPQVSGLPSTISDQVTVIVLPTPVATIEVAPASAQVRVGQRVDIAVIARAADGRQLITTNILPRSTDPSIASSSGVSVSGVASITGLKAGTTDITYQALDQANNPQGTPATIRITVTP